jgi:hypothetical protein
LAAIGGSGGRTTGLYACHNGLTDAGRTAAGYDDPAGPFEIDRAAADLHRARRHEVAVLPRRPLHAVNVEDHAGHSITGDLMEKAW